MKLDGTVYSLIFFACLYCTSCIHDDTAQNPLVEEYSHNELLTTWRLLANEEVIYPLDMSNMPVLLGEERQLFLDNYLIAEANGVTREVQQPKRHPMNPVLAPPREKLNHIVVQHVLQFEQPPRFRMWYWSYDGWQTLTTGQRIRFASSYATSEDGIKWERPDLGLHQVDGVDGPNNIVVPYGIIQGVFYLPNEPDPEQRFKALVLVERKNPTVREGYYIHTSPDGIHWQGDLSRPVIQSLWQYSIPQNGVGDTSRFWWDSTREKFVGDVKFVIRPGTTRCRGIMESDDLVHWSRPTPTFFAPDPRAEVYGHRGFPYQGMYVGMRWIFLPEYSVRHSTYVELDCSRDGRVWTRVATGQAFMGFNPKHDTWDGTIMRPVSMLEVGDELWIYYFAAPTERELENPDYPPTGPTEWSVGLATLPRDRFVAMKVANKQVGTLTTRPIHFSGKRLHVNAEIADGGTLSVAVLDTDGNPIPGLSASNCQTVIGDSLDSEVQWKNGEKLEPHSESGIRLQFHLHNAKLYSFWIAE
ncbi:MAG: hypothetical protein MK538_15550 [Planctomycetes bacterium]|nr:hypothetical protein [Planctomycetota bacterium]